ncbi:MAG: cupin domain-containing protein [Candidatus Omnitrophota bacterium]|nr:MAG: cupin domain-containing protein [Candidatus Omnitrophota bacterium]
MKLHQKITTLRKEKGLKIKDLHTKLKEIFADKALSYRTLLRIEKGHTDGRASSLYQICVGLGITLEELKAGTEEENTVADYIKRNKREGRYTYNERAYAEILTGPKRKFLVLELFLGPKGKTSVEKDPEGGEKFEKWIYVTKGKLTCVIKGIKFILAKGDCICFDSRLAHSFENNSFRRTRCIIIQNPAHL